MRQARVGNDGHRREFIPVGGSTVKVDIEPRNGYTFPTWNMRAFSATKSRAAGPVTRKDAQGVIVSATVALTVKRTKSDTKPTLAKSQTFWYDCKCGRQTTSKDATKGLCHHGTTFSGIDNSGKDHL